MGSIDPYVEYECFFGYSALVIASFSYELILAVGALSVVTSQCVREHVLRMRSGNSLI